MQLTALAASAATGAGRMLLYSVSPLQEWIVRNRTTHGFINAQAQRILAADGYRRAARILTPLLSELERGSHWADNGWRNTGHMYDPRTGQGLWGCPEATEVCTAYFRRAVREWRRDARRRAAFFLGVAAHVVQDLCVPHHAGLRVLDGHSAFEDLAEAVCSAHAVHRGGQYGIAASPADWVRENAVRALPLLPLVGAEADADQMERVIGQMLPLAQTTTAGFLAFFLATAEGVDPCGC